jgi:hypothetical protein
MRRTRVTPVRSLAATNASGAVTRKQNITHANESPFYDYAQFPHPFAITYRGKKYSLILFVQTSYIHVHCQVLVTGHGISIDNCFH